MTDVMNQNRPPLEVADVIRTSGTAFLEKYGAVLTYTQKKALRDLEVCRTAVLGGHVQQCLECGHERIAYNSCRNRHCPKCQASARAAFLEREASYLLPVEYHHVVFTLPQEVAELALWNPAAVYNLLFACASQTLKEVAANPKRLGAQLGVLAVLHTWGQNLHHHPHVHCVVTGGGLSCDAKGNLDVSPRWVSCPAGFLLPVRVLSRVFRGKFVAGLRALFTQGKLRFAGRLESLAERVAFESLLSCVQTKDWVVYAKPPFGGAEQVLKYLARYTHRVAISNQRLVSLEDGRVTFRYKAYAEGHKEKTMTLSAEEFLRRFVVHVLPKGFVKIRHFGLLSNRAREERLALSRRLLMVVLVVTAACQEEGATVEEVRSAACPQCGARRLVRRELAEGEMVCVSVPSPTREPSREGTVSNTT
jgi:predicted Zn-ribbon and HTH transcriptional regulator